MKYQLHNKSYIGATLHPQRMRKAKLRVQGSTLSSLRVPSTKNGGRVSFGLMLDKKKLPLTVVLYYLSILAATDIIPAYIP